MSGESKIFVILLCVFTGAGLLVAGGTLAWIWKPVRTQKQTWRVPGQGPLFETHCRECPDCAGRDTPEGPSALCDAGFKLLQEDMRNIKP
jgi:hypothetical protein